MHKILMIDDDELVRDTLCKLLEIGGFSVLEASDGSQGVEVFKRESPHAVLLDLNMKHMDGVETMEQLKHIDSLVPIIILTGYSDIPTSVKLMKLGAYDCLAKPIGYKELISILQRAIKKLDMEREIRKIDKDAD